MPAKQPSLQAFTLLSAAAVTMDTLVYIDSNGKVATGAAGLDFDGIALNSTAAADAEVSVDPHGTLGNLTIVGTCSAGDLLQPAASGGVKKYVGAAARTVTVANATEIWTLNSHGFVSGEAVRLTNSGGALPAGSDAVTTYFTGAIDANTFYLYDTRANAVAGGATGRVAVSGDGTGTHSIRLYGDQYIVGKAIEAAATSGQKVGVLMDKRHLILA